MRFLKSVTEYIPSCIQIGPIFLQLISFDIKNRKSYGNCKKTITEKCQKIISEKYMEVKKYRKHRKISNQYFLGFSSKNQKISINMVKQHIFLLISGFRSVFPKKVRRYRTFRQLLYNCFIVEFRFCSFPVLLYSVSDSKSYDRKIQDKRCLPADFLSSRRLWNRMHRKGRQTIHRLSRGIRVQLLGCATLRAYRI